MTLSRSLSCRPTVSERGITLTFASGAQVDLLDKEAHWVRDEVVNGEYTSPTREACRSSAEMRYGSATHLEQIELTELAESIAGCEECLKTRSRWVHLL